jgi:hypothetical protein
LFQISSQLKVYAKHYGPPKLQESPFQEFWNSQLGSPRIKWHLGARLMSRHTEYYKGEDDGFPKSGLWWILWVCVCPWFIFTPKVFQLYTNQLVVWFIQVCVNNWLAYHSS